MEDGLLEFPVASEDYWMRLILQFCNEEFNYDQGAGEITIHELMRVEGELVISKASHFGVDIDFVRQQYADRRGALERQYLDLVHCSSLKRSRDESRDELPFKRLRR